jgi:nicotinamide-nucleotide amidase
VGLTGVAGPDPVDGQGPGLVYLGLAWAGGSEVVRLDLPGDRAAVRAGAVDAAMAALLDRVAGGTGGNDGPGATVTP